MPYVIILLRNIYNQQAIRDLFSGNSAQLSFELRRVRGYRVVFLRIPGEKKPEKLFTLFVFVSSY